MTTTPRGRRRRFLRSVLPLLFDLLLVVVLTVLDIRDLFYKVSWIGPYDSFSFTAVSARTFDTKPAVSVKNFTAADRAVATSDVLLRNTTRLSGWPSLLTNCEAFYPAGASLFIGGMGHNCVVFNDTAAAAVVVVPRLYMSASLRADSMAWAACKLLYRHRKPPVCHDHIVTGFLDRYGFQDREVTREMMVLPFSAGEAEVLGVLRVIAKSEPLTRATCFEGFAYEGPALYRTSLFGCGAPNALDSAFVGTYARAFPDLHRDKAWLTVDIINLMGFKYIMRQNVKSEFPATLNAQTGAVELAPKTITNFSSSGGLYNLMICIDVILLVVNLWSSIEIARLMILPVLASHLRALRGELPETAAPAEGEPPRDETMRELVEDYTTGFSTSLYRSRPVVLALAASQLLSWVIVLPNSVIFTWSTGSRWAKIQAYLSCIRLWALVLMLVNEIWDLIVIMNERLAYAVASRTYISTYEIIAVGAAVSYEMRQEVFGVGNTKYAMELQRTKDTTSFAKRLTLQNAYNEALDFQLNTPVDIVWTMYKPLFKIIGWSLFFCILVLLVRFLVHRFVLPFVNDKLCRKTTYATTSKILAASAPGVADADAALDGAIDADLAEAEEIAQLLASGYERLPLEEQLNDPIRARCLVRVSFEIEAIRVNTATKKLQRYILPAYFLEHGVVVDDRGEMHTRHGFFKFLEPRIQFDGCMPVETAEAMRKIASLRKRTSALAAAAVTDKTK